MIQLSKSIGDNFCYAPWTNIHINPNGEYKTCCGGELALGDVRTIPIQEIVNSKRLLDIKKNILDNKVDNNCTNCIRQEQMSNISERGWYDDIAENQNIDITNLAAQYLQNLDIRWSNTCNLSCTYCGPEASSQWSSLKRFPIERLNYDSTLSNILELIQKNQSTIKNLGLLGGEPLLQKENEYLLDVISPDVNINLITNLSVPLENNKIFHKLLNKNRVIWDISFDTVEEKFEYVRHGANWENQIKNIRYLQSFLKDRPNHIIGIAGVYSVYNALDLSEVHRYFKENNLPTPRWNELNHPNILSVISLPERFRLKASEELIKSIEYHSWPRQRNFLATMAENIKNSINKKNDCNDLYEWHRHQEDTYWSNSKYKFKTLWPEYSE